MNDTPRYSPSLDGVYMPPQIAALPIDPVRLLPVPWFVAGTDGFGKPEFRVADGKKRGEAVAMRKCWVCGRSLGETFGFILGPMCVVNRISAEPPSHMDCCEFSLIACPFLSKPKMVRRDGGLPDDATCPGHMIERNPGAACLWETDDYRVVKAPQGKLFRVGTPKSFAWWAEGRAATAEEVAASVSSGLPKLREMAAGSGAAGLAAFDLACEQSRQYFPEGVTV